jgi:hypothetical protein
VVAGGARETERGRRGKEKRNSETHVFGGELETLQKWRLG